MPVTNFVSGAMGIGAGGGYTANAAINDRRIQAVATVSAVNIGSMFRPAPEEGLRWLRGRAAVELVRIPRADGGSLRTPPLGASSTSDAESDGAHPRGRGQGRRLH